MRPYIKLTVVRANGHRSEGTIKGDKITLLMMEAAEDLIHAMDFNCRRPKRLRRP